MSARLNIVSLSLYLFCLFPVLPTLQAQSALAILVMLLLFINALKSRKRIKFHGLWLPVFLGLPTMFLAMSLLYSNNLHQGIKDLERGVLLVVMPWLLFLNRHEFKADTQVKVLRFLALVMSLFSAYAIFSILATGKLMLILPYSNSYYFIREFVSAKTQLHPTYFSILLAIPIFSLQRDLRQGQLKWGQKIFLSLMLLTLLTGLLMASSKMIMGATLVGTLVIWGQGRDLKLVLKFLPLVGLVLVAMLYFIDPLHDRAVDLYKALSEEGVDQNNPDSMRKAIYYSTFHAISENPFFGVGIGDTPATLSENYARFGFADALEKGYNTHNYYLHMWLSAGLIPFLFFLSLQLLLIAIGWATGNSNQTAIGILFGMSLLTENILSRQVGIFTYAFFTAFIAYSSWSKFAAHTFINGRFLAQKLSGVQRFANEISQSLILKSNISLLHPRLKEESSLPGISLPFLKATLWEQLGLAFYLRLIGSPALLNLGNTAPILYRRNYICLHDVAFMENDHWFSVKFLRWYRFMMPRILAKAKWVFTVSEFSKQEIRKHFKVPPNKISVVYNGFPEFVASTVDSKPIVEGDYILSVGSISARKNQKTIVQVFSELASTTTLKLVLVGAYDAAVFGDSDDIKSLINGAPNMIHFSAANDRDLQNLYQHAKGTVYLPFYEGFGLPVLESLAFKKPTIVSDIPVFRELFQDLVLFSAPENRNQLAELIKSIEKDFKVKTVNDLDIDGLRRRFSYQKAGQLIFNQLPT